MRDKRPPAERPNKKMKMPKVGVVAWVSPTIFPFYCAFSKIHRLKPIHTGLHLLSH